MLSSKSTYRAKTKEHDYKEGMINKVLARVYNSNFFSNYQLSANEVFLAIYFIEFQF